MTKFFLYLLFFVAECYATIPLKSFYFVRHGITQWNLDEKQQGKTNIPLHDDGRKQIERLRPLCDTLPITHFHSSSLSRASETMRILNKNKQLPEHIHDDLQEQGKGTLEGITAQEWKMLDRTVIDAAIEDKKLFKERTQRVLIQILSSGKTPCIVSHSNNLRCISQLLGLSIYDAPHGVIWHFQAPIETHAEWKFTEIKNPDVD